MLAAPDAKRRYPSADTEGLYFIIWFSLSSVTGVSVLFSFTVEDEATYSTVFAMVGVVVVAPELPVPLYCLSSSATLTSFSVTTFLETSS